MVRPIELLRRSYEMIREEYWLFLGITVVGMVVASAVPFGILQGPIVVGMFLCFAQRQQTGRTEFGTLFKGFEQFLDAFIATLIMVAVSLVVMAPIAIVFIVTIVVMVVSAGPNAGPNAGNEAPTWMIVAILGIFPLILAATVAIYTPFIFTFQLIADRKMSAGVAVKTSARAAWNNLGGLLWYFFVTGLIMFIAVLPCYIPAILLMPIVTGGAWLLYQDIFGIEGKF